MSLAFVSMRDVHLAASLRVGDVAGSIYNIIKTAEIAKAPAEVIDELKEAHAALNRAAMGLIDTAIAANDHARELSFYSAMAIESAWEASGGAA